MVKDDRRATLKDRRKLGFFEKILWIILWIIIAGSLAAIAYQKYVGG
jgi:hypothetical protein